MLVGRLPLLPTAACQDVKLHMHGVFYLTITPELISCVKTAAFLPHEPDTRGQRGSFQG